MQASYDFENHLVQLGTRDYTAYSYDADGNRLSVSTRLWAPGTAPTGAVSGTTTVYLVDPTATYARVVLESSGGYSPTRYEYGDDLLRMVGTSGASSYYLYDGLGSTRQLTDGSGVVTDGYLYDAYGVGLARAGSTVNSFLFQGQQYDAASGTYYLRARYYDQNNGRFLSQDPFGGSSDDPISLHRYLYASDDPSNRVDPSGAADSNLIGLSAGIATAAPLITAELPAIQGGLANATLNLSAEENVAVAGSEDVAAALQTGSEDFVELYHATNKTSAQAIREGIDLTESNLKSDFGINKVTWKGGFYTTTNLQEAEDWAKNFNGKTGNGAILKFRVPISEFNGLLGKIFRSPNQEWESFVRGGRYGSLYHTFDYVMGPLLKNSDFWKTGAAALAHPEDWNQISFHTQQAVEMLQKYIVDGYP